MVAGMPVCRHKGHQHSEKTVKRSSGRSSVDTGVVQFLDELVKWGAYAVLILSILARFGIQTTSFITLLGSAGVAIGLSLQGSLANFAGGILILVTEALCSGRLYQRLRVRGHGDGDLYFFYYAAFGRQPEYHYSQWYAVQQQYY